MKLLVLEPHGDDALLSCNDLLRTDHDIDILTFSARPSNGIEKFYPSVKSTEYLDCSNLWYPDGKPILKTHQVHRDFMNDVHINCKYVEQLKELFGDEYVRDFNEIYDHLHRKITENNYDIVVCCAGVVHPYHVLLREVWYIMNYQNSETPIPTLWYSDKYYVQNRYGKEMYEDLFDYLNCDSEVRCGWNRLESKNEKISEVLGSVYPSELMLLRFYSDIIEWYPCKYMFKSYEPNVISIMEDLNNVD